MNIFDEIVACQSVDGALQRQSDRMIKRALEEKLADLHLILSRSAALQEQGVRCERDADGLVILREGNVLCRWSCDEVALRLTWAGPDHTAVSTREAVQLSAHVLLRRLSVVPAKPAVPSIVQVPVRQEPMNSGGLYYFSTAH